MARTKQTTRARATGEKPAHFLRGGGPAPGTAGASGVPILGDQGGKAPHGWAPTRRRVRKRTGRIPPALRIVRENATCRMMGTQCDPTGLLQAIQKTETI